jgi:quercetin dioxygenase-like cupin family protein
MYNLEILERDIKNIKINISEEDVLSFLKIRKRWPVKYLTNQPSIEIIDNLGNNDFGNSLFFDSEGYLIYDKWLEIYNLGYTTIMSNVLDLHKDLRNLQKYLNNSFGKRMNGNFYFSKGGQLPSFILHNHEYDVIVKQIYGTGHWILNNNELVLQEQNTLVIPAQSNHQVYKITDKKLSLTINLM